MNLCRQGHPRLIVFPFVVVKNHCVGTKYQLCSLLSHEEVPGQEREVDG